VLLVVPEKVRQIDMGKGSRLELFNQEEKLISQIIHVLDRVVKRLLRKS